MTRGTQKDGVPRTGSDSLPLHHLLLSLTGLNTVHVTMALRCDPSRMWDNTVQGRASAFSPPSPLSSLPQRRSTQPDGGDGLLEAGLSQKGVGLPEAGLSQK
eukprot:2474462-Rhodomonas_salina.1